MIKKITLLPFFLIISSVIGCYFLSNKSRDYMDDPPTHYKQGMKYWDEGKYQQAEEEFNFAKSLDSKYAPAYSGLALITAVNAQNDSIDKSAENKFREAIRLLDKAELLDSKQPQVFIAKAMILTIENEGKPPDEWIENVETEYQKALKLDSVNPEIFYRRGICYKSAYEFSKAETDFKKVIDLNKDFFTQANEQWNVLQKIKSADPQTDVGKKIAIVEKINRADMAALLLSEMKIDELMSKGRHSQITGSDTNNFISIRAIPDITKHWAKKFISNIARYNIRGLELYPDHTFHPNDYVNRGEFALIMEDILIAITGNKSIATRNIGTKSRFTDINPAHPTYNAVCTAVDIGIMCADSLGAFNYEDPVSGTDALEIIKTFKKINKIE